MIKVQRNRLGRVGQGDIYKEIEFIDKVEEGRGILQISKIVFPLIIVLTQDCDLSSHSKKINCKEQNQCIMSILVAPIYNFEHVCAGTHLSQLNISQFGIKKNETPGKNLIHNQNPRYHYLEFPNETQLVPSVIDFKHYFSVNVDYLSRNKSSLVCRISPLYRESISQRFAYYLSRIGLPEASKKNQ
jgi:hypothetical protein